MPLGTDWRAYSKNSINSQVTVVLALVVVCGENQEYVVSFILCRDCGGGVHSMTSASASIRKIHVI